jgi:hypothetical protein
MRPCAQAFIHTCRYVSELTKRGSGEDPEPHEVYLLSAQECTRLLECKDSIIEKRRSVRVIDYIVNKSTISDDNVRFSPGIEASLEP